MISFIDTLFREYLFTSSLGLHNAILLDFILLFINCTLLELFLVWDFIKIKLFTNEKIWVFWFLCFRHAFAPCSFLFSCRFYGCFLIPDLILLISLFLMLNLLFNKIILDNFLTLRIYFDSDLLLLCFELYLLIKMSDSIPTKHLVPEIIVFHESVYYLNT